MNGTREFIGEIVDHQAFLDGTHEYAIEAESAPVGADASWRLMLTLRSPKESDSTVEEGDLTLIGPDGSSAYGALTHGLAHSDFDEDTAEDVLALDLVFEVGSGDGAFAGWQGTVGITGALDGREVRLTVSSELVSPAA